MALHTQQCHNVIGGASTRMNVNSQLEAMDDSTLAGKPGPCPGIAAEANKDGRRQSQPTTIKAPPASARPAGRPVNLAKQIDHALT